MSTDGAPTDNPYISRFKPTAKDIQTCRWDDLLREADVSQVEGYSSVLLRAANAAPEEGEAAALMLLGAITSMYYDDDDLKEPFKPIIVFENGRSAALADFSDGQLDVLGGAYGTISDPEMRARIADVLWIRRRDHKAAAIAVADYLRQAEVLMDPRHWVMGFKRLERAFQVACSLGSASSEKATATAYGTKLLSDLDGNDPLYLSSRIIHLLLAAKAVSPETLAEHATRHAENSEDSGNWMVAADYWSLVRACRANARDDVGGCEALRRRGRAQVKVGEEMAAANNPALAAESWLEFGFLSLRDGQADRAELAPLQKRLQELQKDRIGQATPYEVGMPMSDALTKRLNEAKGQTFQDALQMWASCVMPTTKAVLREQALRFDDGFPLTNLFPITICREDGKIDLRIPPFPRDGVPPEGVLELYMWRSNEVTRGILSACAEFVRRIISEEHPYYRGAFGFLLANNRFVPRGREMLFERGLQAALEGDYIAAAHILIPQIENSIRSVLGQAGVVTTSIRSDGTQNEYDLNKLVELEEFGALFGEDLAFTLRGLLVERADSNLRNTVAHGLLSAGAFFSPASVILGPLCLILLFGFQGRESDS
jgi:hypothetical protein